MTAMILIHDNPANRGINIYSEQSSTAYMTGHKVHDNIICSKGEPYVSGWSDTVTPRRQGQNLWFGAGAPPTWDVSALAAHPSFVDAASDDFRLQPNSPAIDAGADVGVGTDFAWKGQSDNHTKLFDWNVVKDCNAV